MTGRRPLPEGTIIDLAQRIATARLATLRRAIDHDDPFPGNGSKLDRWRAGALARFEFFSAKSHFFGDEEKHWIDRALYVFNFFIDAEEDEEEPLFVFGGWLQGWIDTSNEVRERVEQLRAQLRNGAPVDDAALANLLRELYDDEAE